MLSVVSELESPPAHPASEPRAGSHSCNYFSACAFALIWVKKNLPLGFGSLLANGALVPTRRYRSVSPSLGNSSLSTIFTAHVGEHSICNLLFVFPVLTGFSSHIRECKTAACKAASLQCPVGDKPHRLSGTNSKHRRVL